MQVLRPKPSSNAMMTAPPQLPHCPIPLPPSGTFVRAHCWLVCVFAPCLIPFGLVNHSSYLVLSPSTESPCSHAHISAHADRELVCPQNKAIHSIHTLTNARTKRAFTLPAHAPTHTLNNNPCAHSRLSVSLRSASHFRLSRAPRPRLPLPFLPPLGRPR